MKIEFLNAWQGKLIEPITQHLEQQQSDIDVFCFQEASEELQRVCGEVFPDYAKVTAKKRISGDLYFQQATYIHPEIELQDASTILGKGEAGGFGLAVTLKSNTETPVHLLNFHGVSEPGDKLDTLERVQQSQVIIDFFRQKRGPRVIGGDFNMLPDTRSILMFGEEGYQDLIKDFGIRTTRNRLAWERYRNKQYFSDYVFMRDIDAIDFSVPHVEISDHLPMIVSI